MRAYVVRRLLLAVVTVFLVSVIVFLMVRLIPGNIVDAIIAQQMQIGETSDNREIEAARATIEAQLGLDKPILQQYAEWIARVGRGDLGDSLWRRTPVIEDIAIRWPVTLELGVLGLLIGQLIAIPIGIYSAQRQDTVSDYVPARGRADRRIWALPARPGRGGPRARAEGAKGSGTGGVGDVARSRAQNRVNPLTPAASDFLDFFSGAWPTANRSLTVGWSEKAGWWAMLGHRFSSSSLSRSDRTGSRESWHENRGSGAGRQNRWGGDEAVRDRPRFRSVG
ncbi:MAG: ABC transporter permease [Spirochaetaceae bacterium]|nr:ABC transporter permease [Spirochaetaceae bacterium]